MMLTTKARRRGASLFGLGAIMAALVVGTAGAASATSPTSCTGAKEQVVNVTRHILNDADYGADGHVWALDTYDEHIQLWKVGTHQYCIERSFSGTFVTFAGVSPNGSGLVSAGVSGIWTGTIAAYLTADLAPVAPQTGDLGTADAACDQTGACANDIPSVRQMYFTHGIDHIRYLTLAATFDGGSHGTWHQDIDTSTGDITG